MATVFIILKLLKFILSKEKGFIKFVNLVLQNVFGGIYVKFFETLLIILGDNYINFLTEKQDSIDLMFYFCLFGCMTFLYKTFMKNSFEIDTIIPGIVASVIMDFKMFLVF